jgi:magnesium transporter
MIIRVLPKSEIINQVKLNNIGLILEFIENKKNDEYVMDFEDMTIVNLYSLRWLDGRSNWIKRTDITLIWNSNSFYIITNKGEHHDKLDKFLQDIDGKNFSISVVEKLIDLILDKHRSIVYELERKLSLIEENIFKNESIMLDENDKNKHKTNRPSLLREYINRISRIRKQLFMMRNLLYSLEEILDELNDIFINNLKNSDIVNTFENISKRLDKYHSRLESILDYSNHVRDSWQAQIDLNLNMVMKIFTVITSIFMPLTLLTGWYGMNFTTMKELSWEYGYIMVILFAIIIPILALIFYKKRRLL